MKLLPSLLAASVLAVSGMASAAEPAAAPDQNITRLLQARLGGAPVGEVKKTPVDGIYESSMGGKVVYLSSDGRYVMIGDMIDLQSQVNLTENARRGVSKKAIADFSQDDMIVFPAKDETKSVLTVFTDTSCGYCKKIHEEVPQLQDAGIEVRYIPFPRGGERGPGYQTLRSVWCSEDRAKGLNIAKGDEAGSLPAGNCAAASIVDAGYQLGNEVGVDGTPALFTQSGKKISGYVPYAQLIPMLMTDR